MEKLTDQHWDFVITVCDRAKEACRRLDLFLAPPMDTLSRLALESQMQGIGHS
jgi:hypothetical protein